MIYNIYCKVEFLQFYAVKIDLLCLKISKISQVGDGAQPPPQTPPYAERKNQYCGWTTQQAYAIESLAQMLATDANRMKLLMFYSWSAKSYLQLRGTVNC